MPRIRFSDPILALDAPSLAATPLHRRDFLKALAIAGAGSMLAGCVPDALGAPGVDTATAFPDGVKCGDPAPDGAVLWTRVAAPESGVPFVRVAWLVSEDAAFTRVVAGGLRFVDGRAGHCLHVRVTGLRSDRWYHYRFVQSNGTSSPVGRLRTAPAPDAQPDRLRYAFASCQQRGQRGADGRESLYVTHRAIAEEGVDFLMHLGDYIYVSDFGTITLADYRDRWRVFHSNPLLQDLQTRVPLVAMWDDGEFYNGVDRTGDPARLAQAKRAWFEHMPIRPARDFRPHRAFPWGTLADVFMLDVRSYRDPEVPPNSTYFGLLDAQDSELPPGEQMFGEGRTTLGPDQKAWLFQGLEASRATWRFLGNPYNMNAWRFEDRDTPERRAQDPAFQRNAGLYVSNEAWDDYQAERRELLQHLADREIGNVVVTSGHTHFYLACELQPDFDDPSSKVVAFDFVTGSQTADPDPRALVPGLPPDVAEVLLHNAERVFLTQNAPYMRHVDLLTQGYAVVDATPEECVVTFRAVDTFDPHATARTTARFRVVTGGRTIERL